MTINPPSHILQHMEHTILIDGETLTFTISAEERHRLFPTCVIWVRHPEGGRAAFEVTLHQCEFSAACLTAETPPAVIESIRGMCRRASAWYGKRPSAERVTMERALLENQVPA